MFKNIIAPVQAWLLSQGKCVGCGMPLGKSKVIPRQARDDPERSRRVKSPRTRTSSMRGRRQSKVEDLVTCKCGRIFVYNKKSKKYRRANLNEV